MKLMKKFILLLLALLFAFPFACGCGEEKEPEDKYIVTFSLAWSSNGDSGKFSIDGETTFDKVYLSEGETLGDRLPDLSKIPASDLNFGVHEFTIYGWYYLLNGEEKIVDKDTVFNTENIGVGVGKEIPLKVKYKEEWSPNM